MTTSYPAQGVDLSYAQGHPSMAALPGSFVIVNASRANVGLVVGEDYTWQVDAARAAGREVGHYFFNGPLDPATCAKYFVANLHNYEAGDGLFLDIENTGVVAWTPAQALIFCTTVKSLLGVAPGLYLNQSLMNGADWSQLVALGCPLWLAWPGTALPALKWWTQASVWQHATAGGVDQDKAIGSLASIFGTPHTGLDPDMYITGDTSGTIYLHTGYASVPFNFFGTYPQDATQGPPQIAALFERLLASTPSAPAQFNPEQEAIIAWAQAKLRAAYLTPPAASVALTDVQVAAIATQLQTALGSELTQADVEAAVKEAFQTAFGASS